MLLSGGARAAAGGGIRGAIANTFKQKAIDSAKDKALSIVKEKAKGKKKTISTEKLLSKTKTFGNKIKKGGALVLRKSSAIVKSSSGALVKTEDKKPGGALVKSDGVRGEILKELDEIKVDFIKVKEISTQKLLNQKQESRLNFIEGRKKKAEEQEKNLEEKKDTKKKKKLGITAPKVGLFDMIKRFLLNVLIGSLLNILLKNGPTILRMFKEIGEGLTNTWNVLKLGIITLTTVFPKQVKFIAKLTSKIIGPPAKLIGKLLFKAGRIAGNLFKKAGGVIFNLVKGPLASLVKRVGGEVLEQGARGVAGAAGNILKRGVGRAGTRAVLSIAGKGGVKTTANIIKRFKSFSKIFKRVPVVGALIGIGIDLALGEKLDRAIVGAIGATLGAGIGGAIGQGLIPIPGLGAFIGGSVGAGIGDWAGKEIYKNLTGRVAEADKENPIEGRAYGGQVNIRGGGSKRTLSRSTSIQRKTTGSSAISPQTLKKAKGTILKDEESAKRFANLSSTYGAIPFIGEAMKLGLDISLGEKVSKPRTDAIAESIGSSIGIALKNDEFSVPGFNKRIIGQFSKNLTDWAKRKIFVDVKSQENQFKLLQEKKEEAQPTPGGPGDQPAAGGAGGGMLPGNASPEVKAMLEAISGGEGSWDSVNPSTTVPGLSNMTIADARRAAMQKGYALGGSGAMGKWQQMPEFIIGRAKSSGLNPDKDKFNPENQTKIARMLMASVYPGGEAQLVKDAQKDPLSASAKLRGTWPSLPGGSQQNTSSKTFVARFNANISKYKSAGGGGVNGVKRHKVPFLAMGGNHQVTSDMGMRNFALSPGMHMGVDISGTRGEPLQAFTDGVVEATGNQGNYGNWVNWIDNTGIGHFYAHMDKPAYVKRGQKIKKGTILGPLGSTGLSSGPHLHWEAATNPRDNGMPKSAVLSRFNPLSKYNKESPFGGSIQPDPSIAGASSPGSSGSPGAPSAPSEGVQISDFAANYKVLGDPAAAKGGRGGGSGIVSTKGIWDTGPGYTIQGAKDEQGRPVVFSKGAAEAFYKMMKDSGGKVKASDVSSSKRSPEKNRAVGGASGSLHMSGIAMDIHGGSNSWIRKNGRNYGWVANDYPGSHGGHFEFKGAGLAPSGTDLSAPGSGSAPGAPPAAQISDFALNYKVLGDPAIKSTIPDLSQTASYDKSNGMIMLVQSPGGQSAQPVRKNGSGYKPSFVDGMVNSYGMVSRQLISSSMYKI